jgi:sugar/nucleoside kinase (ribokinase family)
MRPKILVLGGASYDDIIHLKSLPSQEAKTLFADRYYSKIGSTGVGKALALKKLGFDVAFIATIGYDQPGNTIKQAMCDAAIDFYPIYSPSTERHTNLMDEKGQRISIFTSFAEPYDFNPETYRQLIESADEIILNIKPYCLAFLPLLKTFDGRIFCDIHDYDGVEKYHQPFIESSTCLMMSDERIENEEAFVREMLAKGKTFVLVTRGSRGASLYTENKVLQHHPESIVAVDTNGAGDNFFAGFFYGYVNHYDHQQCLQSAQIVAETCLFSEDIVSDELNPTLLRKKMLKIGK